MAKPIYKKMDRLFCCITDNSMFLVLPGQPSKQGAKQEPQLGIMLNCPDATKEEFESRLSTDTLVDVLYKAIYLKEIEEMQSQIEEGINDFNNQLYQF